MSNLTKGNYIKPIRSEGKNRLIDTFSGDCICGIYCTHKIEEAYRYRVDFMWLLVVMGFQTMLRLPALHSQMQGSSGVPILLVRGTS